MAVMRPAVTPVVRPLFRTRNPMSGSFVPRTRPMPRISGPTSQESQRPGGDLDMTDADPSRRGTDPLRPFEVHRLLRSSGMEPSGLDDVRADGAERLRDDVPMSQLRLGPLRLHEDDDARLVRLAAADHLVADPDPDHVQIGRAHV